MPAEETKPLAQPMTAAAALRRLKSLADADTAKFLSRYFKTGVGEYGAGDQFLGIKIPPLRTVSKEFAALPLREVERLLQNSWHEARTLALMILVQQYQCGSSRDQRAIHGLYLKHLKYVNNWDLVDASAATIVGRHLIDSADHALLWRLAQSKQLFARRIAVIATYHFIRQKRFDLTLALGEALLEDKHDLMHKAVGWMLREIGNRDADALRKFLSAHAPRMPRTMLRYAIERLPVNERKKWLVDSRRSLLR